MKDNLGNLEYQLKSETETHSKVADNDSVETGQELEKRPNRKVGLHIILWLFGIW